MDLLYESYVRRKKGLKIDTHRHIKSLKTNFTVLNVLGLAAYWLREGFNFMKDSRQTESAFGAQTAKTTIKTLKSCQSEFLTKIHAFLGGIHHLEIKLNFIFKILSPLHSFKMN